MYRTTFIFSAIIGLGLTQLAVSAGAADIKSPPGPARGSATAVYRVVTPRGVKAKPLASPDNVAVVNAASFLPGVSPGAIASIFGVNLSAVTDIVYANTIDPLPQQLLDISVIVNNVPAPLFTLSYGNGEDQINFQVPYETPVGLGAAFIQILNNGVVIASLTADSYTEDPGVFVYGPNQTVVAIRYPDGALIGPSTPAQRGDILTLYVTGLGPLTVSLIDGYGAPSDPLAYTQDPFTVLINGEQCRVDFSGLAPGFVGLDQINIEIPSDMAAGTLDLQISTIYASSSAGAATIPVI